MSLTPCITYEQFTEASSHMEEIPILKDITFWHLLGTTACGLLIQILNKHLVKTDKTLEKLTDIANLLQIKSKVQEVKIENIENRLEKLEQA
jgi:hypothetical protein